MVEDVKALISELETKRFGAMCSGDHAAVEAMLADSLVYIHSSAAVDDKSSYMEGLRAKFEYKRVQRANERIQIHGDCAVVTGEAVIDVILAGAPRTIHNRYIDVWAKSAQGWQMVAWQSTPIPPKK
jgi:ketosteroid isomerase-like protein